MCSPHCRGRPELERGRLCRNVDKPTIESSDRHMQCVSILARVTVSCSAGTRAPAPVQTLSAGAGACRTGARPAQVAFSNYPLERTRAAHPPSLSLRPASLVPRTSLRFFSETCSSRIHGIAARCPSRGAPENTRFMPGEACLLSRAGMAPPRSRGCRSKRAPWQPARNHQRPRSWCPPSAARGRQESAAH
jgi:hypothetical protein